MQRMAETRGARENALQNPLILQNIFRRLSCSDLLACRLVNRLDWFDLATEVLCEKKENKIDFNFSDKLSRPEFSHAFETPNENPWSLKSLVNCIKQSHFFPCCRFRFSQVYSDDEDLLEFFSIHGDSVIELEIDLMARTNVNTAVEKFGEILWKKLSNLEKLTIWKVSLGWNSSIRLFSKQDRETVKLENLKYLNFKESLGNRNYKFIQDIQDAAPNLEESNVQAIPFVPPEAPVDSDLITFFSEGDEMKPSLTFSPENSNLRFYERLVRASAKFSKIIINLEKVRETNEIQILCRVTGILTEILKLSQPSLRELNGFMEIFSFFKISLDLFVFPHVSKLEFKDLKTPGKNQSASEEKENFSQTFPHLSNLFLESLDFSKSCGKLIQTLKTLKTNAEFSSAGDFQKLGKIFPNVEHLELSTIKNFQECADSLWKNFGKVTKLKIEIIIENVGANQKDVSMDTAFLGTETSSSILELQDLENLNVTFTLNPQKTGSENGNGKWTCWNFLRKSTVIHLLEKLKQLKSIDLIVDATRTDCKNEGEIYKQLIKLKSSAAVRVHAKLP